ncbi:MAG: hypothetical protein NC911_00295, partial [Candidatus Omnitrophica bacterium]|nr:hypothetical protein [Candidatus Omnitrophota bacterium]
MKSWHKDWRGIIHFRRRKLTWGLLFLLFSTRPQAQIERLPQLGYLFPGGGQRGTTLEILVGGSRLMRSSAALISGKGVEAEVIEVFPALRSLSQEQRKTLRWLVNNAYRKLAGWPVKETLPPEENSETLPRAPLLRKLENPTKEDLQRIVYEYLTPKKIQQFTPAIAETVLLKLTISPDAEPGWRQLRLVTPTGLSQPLPFQIGTWPEVLELEPNEKNSPLPVKLPVVINGQIEPGDVDTFRFQATKGQKLLITVWARRLVPFLADAVPGWFEALATLYDRKGKVLASADCYEYDPDPVITWMVPETDEYILEIRDSLYRGRKDFVYRVSISESPLVKSIFPAGAREGNSLVPTLYGWNLPVDKIALDTTPGYSAYRETAWLAG